MAAHRYWRLTVNANWGSTTYHLVAGLALRSTPGGTNHALTGNGTSSASSNWNLTTSDSPKAFDDNTTTTWASANNTVPAWLQWDFGSGNEKDIVQAVINLSTAAQGYNTNGFVRNTTLGYSDNGSTWTTLITMMDIPQAAGSYTYDYTPPASATVSATAPAGTLTFVFGGYMALVAPAATLSASGGPRVADAALIAPAPTVAFTAHDSYGENAVLATAPKPTLSSYCGGSAKLSAPSPSLSSTATATGWATATLSAPVPTLSASGAVSAVARVEVTAPVARLIGYGGAVCSITTSAGTLTASGTGGGVAHVAITVPLAQLSAGVTAQNYGSAILVAPAGRMAPTLQAYLVAPAATLTAIGTATITATYEAYTLNLNHSPGHPGETVVDETTRYTNFPFTHVIRYQNSYYGVSDGSLYLLEGTTDDGVDIPYEVVTAKTDFGQTLTKTLVSAYLGGRIGPAETITLIAGDSAPVSYAYTTPRGPHAQNYRQKFGRGIKDRYYALGVSGAAEFSLDTIDIELNQLTRRI